MNCPLCDEPIQGRLHFCPNCGAELPQAEAKRACPHCGAEMAGRASFCPVCGEQAAGEKPAKRVVVVRRPSKEVAAAKPPAGPVRGTQPAAGLGAPAGAPKPGAGAKAADRPGLAAGPRAKPQARPIEPPQRVAEPGTQSAPKGKRAAPQGALAGRLAGAQSSAPATAAHAPVSTTGAVPAAEPPAASMFFVSGELPAEVAAKPAPPTPATQPPTHTGDGVPRPPEVPALEDTKQAPADGRAKPAPEPAAEVRKEAAPVPAAASGAALAARQARRRPWRFLALVGLMGAMAVAALFVLGPERGGLEFPDPSGLLARGATPALQPAESTPEQTATPTAFVTATPSATASPTPSSTPKATTPTPLVHKVAAGESLRAIAERYGVSSAEIIRANNLGSDVIHPGQELIIPAQAQPTPAPRPAVHVVQAGENLVTIAQKYGVPLADLLAANGLTDPNVIKAGQELKIPGGELAPTPIPTEAPTATVTPAATLVATAAPATTPGVTATVAYEFAAPSLLQPAQGATVEGAEDVLLNWTSVGLLADDTWYVVKVWRDDAAAPVPPPVWTRTTSSRIFASFRPAADATSRRFYWSVTVTRSREGEAPVPLSPASEERWFEWR